MSEPSAKGRRRLQDLPAVSRLEKRVYELEQAQLPLRAEVNSLTTERDRAVGKMQALERQNAILRDAVDALVRVVAEFASDKKAVG